MTKTQDVAWSRPAIAVLAGLGAMLTGYITYSKLTAAEVAFCKEGAGCDLVLQSAYASLFGVPLSLFGLGLYLCLLLAAVLPGIDRLRWPTLFGLSLAGVTFTGYLVYLLVFELSTFCLYCAASAVLISAIFLLTLLGHRWEQPDNLVIAGLGVVLAGMAASYGTFTVQSAQAGPVPYATALAKHLRNSGAKFYGAAWCPHCKQQKAFFGEQAMRFVPYVECSPSGQPDGTQTPACQQAGIQSYPTWIIDGRTYAGEYQLDKLAEISGFQKPTAEAGQS
jgi:uncharacterized membrane protein/glutaredoxin